MLSAEIIKNFQNKIYCYYKQNKRDFPWRKSISPYRVLVSEIMLQQTQVSRVAEKFVEFIKAFPNFKSLSKAPLKEVLRVWQGMGYNRRALYLKRIAEIIVNDYKEKLPVQPELLEQLPGIGPNTAASICAYAYNAPTIFIETNIRTIFIHEFFHHKKIVSDKDVLPLVGQTLDAKKPREWFNALMDYGTMLKAEHPNPNRKSKHYIKQSTFKGSEREIRGKIIKLLTQCKHAEIRQIAKHTDQKSETLYKILNFLVEEKLIQRRDNVFFI